MLIYPVALTVLAFSAGIFASTLWGNLHTRNVGGSMAVFCIFCFLTLVLLIICCLLAVLE